MAVCYVEACYTLREPYTERQVCDSSFTSHVHMGITYTYQRMVLHSSLSKQSFLPSQPLPDTA
jgi:hypothetical protein